MGGCGCGGPRPNKSQRRARGEPVQPDKPRNKQGPGTPGYYSGPRRRVKPEE